MKLLNNYYLSSFFWSTFQKIVTAIVGFVSVPLLLGYYGKADYGILGIATASNGYMHLLDLGMNVGAVKFFSQWRTEGRTELINRVARTNITFYIIISIINIVGLVALAAWGESVFSVSHDQFIQLRYCLLIIALFNVFSWSATTFNQLLVAHMQMAYTMRVQSVIALLKGLLVGMVFIFDLTLIHYFFYLTGIVAALVIPYAFKCKRHGIIKSLKPAFYWKDFKIVITFSLSIFALSLFQMTATQSRPIILSIFANNGAEAVAEFKIIEVIPLFIISIGGAFTSIFLPKTSSMVTEGNIQLITDFAYKWTKYTTIIVNILTIPFILCAKEVLSAYVGENYNYLSVWLIIWCVTVLLQMHTTPGNALVLAYGRTKLLVLSTAIFCIMSVVLNAFLCSILGVGAAIVSYFFYVVLVIGLYYSFYYKRLMSLSRWKMFTTFIVPTFFSFVIMFLVWNIPLGKNVLKIENSRLYYICIVFIKSLIWLLLYFVTLFLSKIVNVKETHK